MKRLIIIMVAMATMFTTPVVAQNSNVKYQSEVFVSGGAAIGDMYIMLGDMTKDGMKMTYSLSVQTIQGAKFGDYFSAGIGLGLDFLAGPADDLDLFAMLIPVYADFKFWIPTNGRITPYLMAEAGGSFNILPSTIRPLYGGGVGIKLNDRFAMSLNYVNDGYRMPTIGAEKIDYSYNEHKLQLRFSWIF